MRMEIRPRTENLVHERVDWLGHSPGAAAGAADADSDWPAADPRLANGRGIWAGAALASGALRAAPPSVRLVYLCLRSGAGDSTSEVGRLSGLPERTVRYAVRWLVDRGLCERHPRLSDTRRIRFGLVSKAQAAPARGEIPAEALAP